MYSTVLVEVGSRKEIIYEWLTPSRFIFFCSCNTLESLLVREVCEIVYVGDTIHIWTLILSSFASPTEYVLNTRIPL